MMGQWSLEGVLGSGLLILNILLDIRGLVIISDAMQMEQQNAALQAKIRQHQIERQRILGHEPLTKEDEGDLNLNEFGDPIADLWRTTVFTTQTTYEKTVRIAGASCLFLLLVAGGVVAGF